MFFPHGDEVDLLFAGGGFQFMDGTAGLDQLGVFVQVALLELGGIGLGLGELGAELLDDLFLGFEGGGDGVSQSRYHLLTKCAIRCAYLR